LYKAKKPDGHDSRLRGLPIYQQFMLSRHCYHYSIATSLPSRQVFSFRSKHLKIENFKLKIPFSLENGGISSFDYK